MNEVVEMFNNTTAMVRMLKANPNLPDALACLEQLSMSTLALRNFYVEEAKFQDARINALREALYSIANGGIEGEPENYRDTSFMMRAISREALAVDDICVTV